MALRITRAVDSRLYGGFDLDSADLERSSDHIVWVRRVSVAPNEKYGIFNIFFPKERRTLEIALVSGEEFELVRGVFIKLAGVQNHWIETQEFCDVCGRGDPKPKRLQPQARLGLTAPREYKFLRDDARKK